MWQGKSTILLWHHNITNIQSGFNLLTQTCPISLFAVIKGFGKIPLSL